MNNADQMNACRHPMHLLITGGTGSLGYAVVEKLLSGNPVIEFDKIMIYSRDEQKQAQMQEYFKNNIFYYKLRFLIGDIRDKDRLKLAVKEATHIIHMAALKIVPSIEYNPQECIKTNVIGAQNLIEVCSESYFHDRKILAISTDKAVYPINLYGASKLSAEKLFIEANNLVRYNHFSVCRYGNVTGSRGSVIPFFRQCLEDGKPLTITDPKMTRFWITLDEASDFVLKSLKVMEGAEIFVPDMVSYKITDLAELMIEDKFGPDKQYPTKIIGLRPGEKIHEHLLTEYEFDFVWPQDDGYEIIKKEPNLDNMRILKEARDAGWPVKNSYNSSMFVVDKEILRELMIADGIIDIPFEKSTNATV